MTAEEQFSPAIMMAQLREHLSSREAKALIAGKTDPAEAWLALNRRYGDKDLALVNVKYKLVSLDTSKGEGYEKVETLLQGVNKARATLKAVGAEAELFNNVSVVAQLVAKLPASEQERWHQDRTSTDFREDQRKLGEKFLAWLERQGAATNSARLTQQALSLTKQPLISPPMPRCGRVEKVATRPKTVQGEKKKGSTGGSPGSRARPWNKS